MRRFFRLHAQIQFQINFRDVQIAQRQHVRVPVFLALLPRGPQHLDRPAVFAAQIVKVGDVVIALGHQQRHAVLDAHFARPLISRQGPRKIIQRNQAHRHVVQRHRQPLRIAKRQQHFVRALVARQPFLKTVLPVVNVPHIDLNVRPAFVVAQFPEDFLGLFRRGKRLIVFSQQNERLDGGNQRARFFFGIFDFPKNLQGFVVEFQSLFVFAQHVQRVGLRTQTAPQSLRIVQTPRNHDADFAQMQRLARIFA